MSQKFEDTQLLQHPEVQKAYDIYLEQKNSGDEHKMFVADMTLAIATTISQLGANKDPHLVAASLIGFYYMNNSEDAVIVDKLQKSFDSLTLEYVESVHVMMHPMGIEDIFPGLPPTHQRAAVTILAAMQINHLEDFIAQAPKMTPAEVKNGLRDFDDGDPVMPSFEQLAGYVSLRKHEPQLMAAFDALHKSLEDIGNGKTPKPAAPAASTPAP